MKIRILKKEYGAFEIEVNDVVVGSGCMMVAEHEDDFSYLERIDIFEEYQNQGFGTAALYALCEIYGGFFLAPDNEGARRLYDRIADSMKQKDYDAFGFSIDQGFGVYEM